VGLLSVQLQGGDVLDTLEQYATRDTDGNVRRAAISYLGRRPEDTVRHLTMILSGADDPDDRAVALEALANRMGPAGVDRLIAAARDGNEAEKIRAVAISFLGDIDDPRATDALETIFDSSDLESLRRRALRELAERKTGDGYIVNWLAGIAHSDPSLEIRKEAVRLLGRTALGGAFLNHTFHYSEFPPTSIFAACSTFPHRKLSGAHPELADGN
jgi:HEAT repeat protein